MVYNVVPSPAVDSLPVLNEPLHLVSGRSRTRGRKLMGSATTLAELATHPLVIPSRPHSMRMRLETALANVGCKARVALEIESIPAILDLVKHEELHAGLVLNAIQSTGNEADTWVRPICKPKLAATRWIATSSRRPRGPLIEPCTELVPELRLERWA